VNAASAVNVVLSSKLLLHAGTMGAETPLTEERSAKLAHEAARMGYPAAQVTSGGIIHIIMAKFDAAIEAGRLGREYELVYRPNTPLRTGMPVRLTDTATIC